MVFVDLGRGMPEGQPALLKSRFHVFYSAMPEMGSGFKPVEAADAYSEAPQLFDQPASQSPASLQWNLILGVAAANQ